MNKNEINQTATGAPAPAAKRPLTALIAVFVALCLLAGALGVYLFVDFPSGGTSSGGGTQNGSTAFDYYKALTSDYIALTKDMVTGLTIPGFDSRVDEVTEENVKTLLNKALLSKVALTSDELSNGYYLPIRTEKIDYADEVFFYILWVEKANGERVSTKFFDNAYGEAGSIQIGMESFGKEFDDALTGRIPMESGSFETRPLGAVGENDVVLITYTVTEKVPATEEGGEESVKNHVNETSARIDLSKADAAWRKLLLDNYGTIGQFFRFEYEEDIDGDGKNEKVLYEGMIDAAITEETYISFTVKLPEDFFGKSPKDPEYAELNGASLTFYVSIDYCVKHAANTVDTMTFTEMTTTLESVTGVTFTPKNLTTYQDATKKITTAEGAIKTYKESIKTLENDIVRLEKEIKEFTEKDPVANADKITKRQNTLAAKKTALAEKQAELAVKEAELPTLKDAQKAQLAPMRVECIAEYKKQLAESYDATVKNTAVSLIWEQLLETLSFIKLPEEPVKELIKEATDALKSSYDSLSSAQKLYYRDIDEYAASYFFGYDEEKYSGYADYIENSLAPKTIKQSLLYPGIYKTLINDQKKLDAAIQESIEEIIESNATVNETTGAVEKPSKQDVIDYFGNDYLRNYAISGLVDDYLAENNTIDWDTAKPEA